MIAGIVSFKTKSMAVGNEIISLDVGQKRLGVARANSQARLAEPLMILPVDGSEFERLSALIRERGIRAVVIGRPGPTPAPWWHDWCAQFRDRCRWSGPVVYQDETLTSVAGQQRSGRQRVDDVAAAIILEDYLEESTNIKAAQK